MVPPPRRGRQANARAGHGAATPGVRAGTWDRGNRACRARQGRPDPGAHSYSGQSRMRGDDGFGVAGVSCVPGSSRARGRRLMPPVRTASTTRARMRGDNSIGAVIKVTLTEAPPRAATAVPQCRRPARSPPAPHRPFGNPQVPGDLADGVTAGEPPGCLQPHPLAPLPLPACTRPRCAYRMHRSYTRKHPTSRSRTLRVHLG
jgi:hypothetical protein